MIELWICGFPLFRPTHMSFLFAWKGHYLVDELHKSSMSVVALPFFNFGAFSAYHMSIPPISCSHMFTIKTMFTNNFQQRGTARSNFFEVRVYLRKVILLACIGSVPNVCWLNSIYPISQRVFLLKCNLTFLFPSPLFQLKSHFWIDYIQPHTSILRPLGISRVKSTVKPFSSYIYIYMVLNS